MLGLSSSLLLASLMNRSFAHLGGPDVCSWMQGPLCSWRELPEKAMVERLRVSTCLPGLVN
jgi:hypothetical protein